LAQSSDLEKSGPGERNTHGAINFDEAETFSSISFVNASIGSSEMAIPKMGY
jgi:hypothetical protein